MALKFRNTWGSQGSNLDQQRGDLFRVVINLPNLGTAGTGNGLWNSAVEFAVSKFPFPTRARQLVPLKYLNQTNMQLGADAEPGTVEMTVRYAFTQQTAAVLERWHWLTSHPNGSVARTSAIKTDGKMYWLAPNQALSNNANAYDDSSDTAFVPSAAYVLEGILIVGYKPTDADMESGNNLVNLMITLSIDRYYPLQPEDLQLSTNPNAATP